MALTGDYEPSPAQFVEDHVRRYEETGDPYSGPFDGQPCVILTTRGRRSGKLRKTPVVRIEREGRYAVVASTGGGPKHPQWYLNLVAEPEVLLQDGPKVMALRARTATPEERADWWPHATAVWPQYDDYGARTDRVIPLVLFDPSTEER
ncbi:nitroreductase family deazaflavin-dependent oxidoreductase [Pseudonocardia ailaonensis]|uniref:Nitroreductase family deazaflavin-dependent oxidoreductase n=1 Tax=Pseudonocardia ailaonensis TaxID=367279 RepID=A0ABN2MJV7_9PSEU